jgi:sensor domain CHASE-containing protein
MGLFSVFVLLCAIDYICGMCSDRDEKFISNCTEEYIRSNLGDDMLEDLLNRNP